MAVNFSKTKIDVGRDFKTGDISGVAAIGSNNTQTIYKNCNFEYPDGATIPGKLWLYAGGVRPNTDPDKIFGRQEELEKIDLLLKDKLALAITGFRGTGKSTLASMYIDLLEQREEYAGIYWRKVDETVDISDIVGSFFTVIGKPIQELGRYSDGDLLDLFLRELNIAPYFLVLDNFEILLDPQTNKPMKPGFSELIERVKNGAGRSRIVFTSWECPASDRGIRPKCYTISGLDDSSALRFLRESGLTEPEDELKKAIILSGGHPLALILLVQLIDDDEDLSNILDDNILWMGDKGEVAVNILDKVYEERLNENEKKLLQYVSLYRSPVPIQAIVTVANDSGLDKVTCKELALQLKRKSLLEKTGENYWEKSLISIYAYNKLDDIAKHHKSARDYFISLPLPEERTSKEDIQPLIEAYYHACRAKEYNIAAYIIFFTKIDSYLDLWGNYRTLVELYTELLPKNHFKDKPLIDIEIHSFILFNLGNIYIYLGEIKKAIEYIQAALTIYKEIYDRDGESGALGKLGNAYSFLDDNEKAINCYQEAIKISQEIDDRQNEGVWVGELGKVYNHIGKVEKAIQHFQEALDISREVEDKLDEGCFLGNLGNIYLHQEVEKAIEYYHNAIQISQENEDKHNEGIWMGNLGLAYSYLNETEKAIEYYQKAIKISQKIDDKPGEGVLLGNLGLAYIISDKVEKGIKYCQKALTISQETGDRSNESVVFSSLGNAYILLDDIEKAIDFYQNALIISQEINYRFQEGTIYLRLGIAFTYLENFEMASENFKTAMAIGREIKDPMMIGFCEKELKSLCF